jgi:hypothetical protein
MLQVIHSLSRYCCIILMIGQIIEDVTVVEEDGSSNFLADLLHLICKILGI